MERIKQNLETAKADLLHAQARIHSCRILGDELLAMWIVIRHRAADRLWDLQQMASPSI